jgi:alpha-beta hydrolase superfamily lysophospholipase
MSDVVAAVNKRILFLHGKESGPTGSKARWLAERYGAVTPSIDTSHFETAVAQARDAVTREKPDLVIGSSYGGALLLRLLHDGVWRGPSLFLAQAGVRLDVAATLPKGTRAILVHGDADDVVPVEGSRILAASGGPGVELWELKGGDHRLLHTLEDGTLARAVETLLDATRR